MANQEMQSKGENTLGVGLPSFHEKLVRLENERFMSSMCFDLSLINLYSSWPCSCY